MGHTLSLYELAEEAVALDALVAQDEGEWTETHEALANELVEKLVQKADSFGGYVRSLEADADACAEEIARLAARKQTRENRVKWLKSYAMMAMQRIDRPKIEGTLFTIALQNNTPRVDVSVQPDALPPEFVRVVPEKREADKDAIRNALKNGQEIPGCELVVTQSVRIR